MGLGCSSLDMPCSHHRVLHRDTAQETEWLSCCNALDFRHLRARKGCFYSTISHPGTRYIMPPSHIYANDGKYISRRSSTSHRLMSISIEPMGYKGTLMLPGLRPDSRAILVVPITVASRPGHADAKLRSEPCTPDQSAPRRGPGRVLWRSGEHEGGLSVTGLLWAIPPLVHQTPIIPGLCGRCRICPTTPGTFVPAPGWVWTRDRR
jgi:hypothetical protein